ncbi:hypothetical protein HDU82_002943 [Entophlyctis luteolus]|nr:hypothetical protein HDU82_002943 [Entophlyctis luteolus]
MAESPNHSRALSPTRYVTLSKLKDPPVREVPKKESTVKIEPDGYYTRKHPQYHLFKNDNLWSAIASKDINKIREAMRTYVNVENPDGTTDTLERGKFELGGEGETILHAAVLLKCKRDIIEMIVTAYPNLLGLTFQGTLYRGENEMHIAVAQASPDELDVVKYLLQELKKNTYTLQKVMSARAVGREISSESGPLHSFGETVFHYAVKAGNIEVLELLIEAFPDCVKDKVEAPGYNSLHLLVKNLDMPVDRLVQIYRLIAKNANDLPSQKSKNDKTPVDLAFELQNVAILEILKIPLWEFERTNRFRFPISTIDPIMCKRGGLIEKAVDKGNKLVLEHPVVDTIFKCKWKMYAREIFVYRLLGTIIYVAGFLTPAISYQLYNIQDRRTYDFTEMSTVRRFVLELGATTCAVIALFLELRQYNHLGRRYFSPNRIGENINQWLICAPVIATAILRVHIVVTESNDQAFLEAENVLLGISCISGWIHFLSFAKGSEQVGPLVLVFWKTLFRDFAYWLWVYVPLTLGFAAALFLQMQKATTTETNSANQNAANLTQYPANSTGDWNSYGGSAVWTLRFILQQAVFDDFRTASSFPFTAVLYFIYSFVVVIMFLNIFIAMLVETFNSVQQDKHREWKLQLASLILDIDLQLSELYRKRVCARFGYHLKKEDPDDMDKALGPGGGCSACSDHEKKYFHFTEHIPDNPVDKYRELISVTVRRSDDGETFKTLQMTELAHWTSWPEFLRNFNKFLLWKLANILIDTGLDSIISSRKKWKDANLVKKMDEEKEIRKMADDLP